MLPLPLVVALAHLRTRKRQTLVSVLGVTLGVGVFISISGMMQGFQSYFLSQIVETNPHVIVTDEIRRPAPQPLRLLYPDAAIRIERILPRDPVRGIASASAMLEALSAMPGVAAAPTLRGQMILRRAGRDYAVTALGIDPERELLVTSLQRDMRQGSIQALASRPDGIIIGSTLAEKMGAALGDTVAVATARGGVSAMRVVGIFHTGLDQLDTGQVYVALARQQSMQARPRVVNEIHVKLADIARSIPVAAMIEGRWGYKAAPWEETYARILSVFQLQNVIIYSTTGSILIVAGFGIFNIISTVVLEKARDIAIMRAIGLPRRRVIAIFVFEGLVVGLLGTLAGWGLGYGLASILRQVPSPGATEPGQMLLVLLSPTTFGLASLIAMGSSVVAAWLPARRAARTDPLAIIRGAT